MTDKTDSKEREVAEQWLRDRYGAYRGHFAWSELEEAFLAGRASLAASAVETKEYADGTTATGIAPLPKHSPNVQHALRVLTDVESMLGGANGPTIQIRAVLESLAASAGSEPVATVFTMAALAPGGGVKYHATFHKPLPAGTKLYAHPSPPEGMVMVPIALAIDSPIRDVLITWMEKGIKGECFLYKDMWAAIIAAAPPTTSAGSRKGE